MHSRSLIGRHEKRVAIARALAYDADLLLMDEPFGALDAQTRLVMQALLLQVWEGSGKTVLFVTHDIDEAIYLADRILIMSAGPGSIKQEYKVVVGGRAAAIFSSPRSSLSSNVGSSVRYAMRIFVHCKPRSGSRRRHSRLRSEHTVKSISLCRVAP